MPSLPRPLPPLPLEIKTEFRLECSLQAEQLDGWGFRTQVVILQIKGTPLPPKETFLFTLLSLFLLNPARKSEQKSLAPPSAAVWERI